MIGGKFKRSEEFLQVLEEGPKIVAGFSLGDLLPSSSWLASLIRGTTRLAERNHCKSFKLMEHVIKQLEERRDAAMKGNYDMEEREDLVDVLLRIREERGIDVPLTMGMIKAVILVSTVGYNSFLFSAR
jgi:hypothetical protein